MTSGTGIHRLWPLGVTNGMARDFRVHLSSLYTTRWRGADADGGAGLTYASMTPRTEPSGSPPRGMERKRVLTIHP